MSDDLTPPQERSVRLALNAARYRTTLAATAAQLAQLAVTAHRQAVAIRRLLEQADTDECQITPDGWCATHSSEYGPAYCDDPGEPAELDHYRYPEQLHDARSDR